MASRVLAPPAKQLPMSLKHASVILNTPNCLSRFIFSALFAVQPRSRSHRQSSPKPHSHGGATGDAAAPPSAAAPPRAAAARARRRRARARRRRARAAAARGGAAALGGAAASPVAPPWEWGFGELWRWLRERGWTANKAEKMKRLKQFGVFKITDACFNDIGSCFAGGASTLDAICTSK